MATYLMSRENRKRKRDLYLRAQRALFTLNETIREMRDITCDLSKDYSSIGNRKAVTQAVRCEESMVQIDDRFLRLFLDLPEDL